MRGPPSLGAVCFSGAARPVGLNGVGGVVLRGLDFRSIRYVSSIVMFLPLSGLCGAAASSLLFGGLGGIRGLEGLWGVAFRGMGLSARGGGGHSYLNHMILIHFSFHAVVLIMVGIN